MNRNLKIVQPNIATMARSVPYQEIAVYVRDLLKCDYAFVAIPQKDSIRIQAFAGAEPETASNIASGLVEKLRGWGPVIADDSRLVAVPMSCGGHWMGALVGYSSKPGNAFTAGDLEKLVAYSHVAVGLITTAAAEITGRTSFSTDELLHFSRLITIGELSACFAHEVTNPLTLIRGHLRFAEESLAPDNPLRTNLEVIGQASLRIEEMAKRMLDFTKKRKRHTQRCNIAEVISDALRFVQPYFKNRFIDVHVQLESQLPILKIDRWQTIQAIVNLLQNAADAMAEVDRRAVTIAARADANHMDISIADTGKGIEPGNVSQIFDPFFTTKGELGTGLGLYIAKRVIEDHRGTIHVETGARGTTFVISLPL
jgi:signal transduction histidine kinase